MIVKIPNGRKLFCGADRPVHVNAYIRVRFGKFEFVREHCRSAEGAIDDLICNEDILYSGFNLTWIT